MSELLRNQHRIAYELEGPPDAPVVVLVHSLGTGAVTLAGLASALRARFRVLTYDLPGHGGSSAPPGPYSIAGLAEDLLALLDALGVVETSLIGVSIGGMIATELATKHPSRVARLVLACTGPVLPSVPDWPARAAQVRTEGLAPMLEGAMRRWFTESFRAAQPELVAEVAALLLRCDPEGYAACCEAIGACDQWGALASVRAPTLVLAGGEDPVATPELALREATAIEGAELVVLAGVAHLAHLAAPARVADLVLEHLTGGPRAAGMAMRKAVLGESHVARASEEGRGLGSAFQELITAYAWGEIWTRPGLELRMRSAITLAMLVALGRSEELTFHLPAAERSGLSRTEIEEILLQCAIYAGVPAANRAFAVARAVLGDEPTP